MPTTTANIALSSDATDSVLSLTNEFQLFKAGNSAAGMDTMTSVSKTLTSNYQVDLLTTAAAGGSTHSFLYINNPSTDATEYFRIGMGAASGDANGVVVEEIGYLYAGDWMMIPYSATEDIIIWPGVSTAMTVEYMLFN